MTPVGSTVVRAGLVIACLLALAGCGSTAPTPPATSSAQASAAAVSSPSVPVTSSTEAPSPATPAASAAVALDPSLLMILPPTVDAVPVTAEPDSLADAVANPDFVANVAAAAFPIVVDGSDLASGVVARLRPAVYTEAFFRDWRDTYDRGACAQAGGVARTAQSQLGGRAVYIASCAAGLLVYHAYLPQRNVIVSVFSLGDRRFGEQLLSDLRP